MEFLRWIEGLGFSTFVRESDSLLALPMFLFVHILGMSIVAGCSAVIDFAVLGLWPRSPLKPLERFYPLIWFGFVINLLTGTGLFMADAVARGRNVDFYVKLLFVAGGVATLVAMRREVFANGETGGPLSARARRLAWTSLVCWFGAIVAGRLIAYVGPVPGL